MAKAKAEATGRAKANRYYIESEERPIRDAQEERAMLRHRLAGIEFFDKAYRDSVLDYVFFSDDGRRSFILRTAESHAELDRWMKSGPYWPYCRHAVVPIISTSDLVSECQDYLGEKMYGPDAFTHIEPRRVKIADDDIHILAHKNKFLDRDEVDSYTFNPLLSDADQREIHRRLLVSQRQHNDPMELVDVNPLGIQAGICIFKSGDEKKVLDLIRSHPIAPDTKTHLTRLHTLKQAAEVAKARLKQLHG